MIILSITTTMSDLEKYTEQCYENFRRGIES